MKKFFLLFSVFCFFAAVQAQNPAPTTAPSTTSKATTTNPTGKEVVKLADHVCTTTCKEGKHAYAHGEKGHVCNATCAAPKKAKKSMKPTTKPVATDAKVQGTTTK